MYFVHMFLPTKKYIIRYLFNYLTKYHLNFFKKIFIKKK